ncbi:MAG: YodC family protein [Stenotrophomonas indicatrix]|uniref:YodC family protein n=1 Tax=Stenotrophomonas indicatrix TaxID=2045451 RepID=UPI003D0B2833
MAAKKSPSKNEFVAGDLVELLSGGPTMTVNDYIEYRDTYKCQWFAGKKLDSGEFKFSQLKRVEADD